MLDVSSPAGPARPADPVPARAGIGLRFRHHDQVIASLPNVDWFEVNLENYLAFELFTDDLDFLRQTYPISLHATGLSLGSADGVDDEYLADVAAFCRRIEPGLISDHLSWGAGGRLRLPALLPLSYDEETLAVAARNIDRLQTVLGRPILIGNGSTCLASAESTLTEAQFLRALVSASGCGVLLEVNNVAVAGGNLGQASSKRLELLLDHVPSASIGEIHLAGKAIQRSDEGAVLRTDDHGSPISPDVWSLFESVVARLGPRPALIERGSDIPAFSVLRAEAATVQSILDRYESTPAHAMPR